MKNYSVRQWLTKMPEDVQVQLRANLAIQNKLACLNNAYPYVTMAFRCTLDPEITLEGNSHWFQIEEDAKKQVYTIPLVDITPRYTLSEWLTVIPKNARISTINGYEADCFLKGINPNYDEEFASAYVAVGCILYSWANSDNWEEAMGHLEFLKKYNDKVPIGELNGRTLARWLNTIPETLKGKFEQVYERECKLKGKEPDYKRKYKTLSLAICQSLLWNYQGRDGASLWETFSPVVSDVCRVHHIPRRAA